MAKRRLLIVDNRPAIRAALRNYFEGRGYEVAEAGPGAEALAQFQKLRPDALAVDCHLPDEDNNKLMGEIESVLPAVPIIMVASYPNIERAVQSLDPRATSGGAGADLPLAEIEKRHIGAVLRNNRGNVERSAAVLGISRSSLYERVKRYGLRFS